MPTGDPPIGMAMRPLGESVPSSFKEQVSPSMTRCPACYRWSEGELCPNCEPERFAAPPETVNHPAHYGGGDNPLEVIKIIEHYELGFALGNCVKYVLRAGKKGELLEDLKKARWYLDREISRLEAPRG